MDWMNQALLPAHEAINRIQAMKGVDGTRELAIKSQRAENEQVAATVSDTGVGLPAQQGPDLQGVSRGQLSLRSTHQS